jgi:hypothetical protein
VAEEDTVEARVEEEEEEMVETGAEEEDMVAAVGEEQSLPLPECRRGGADRLTCE